MKKERLWGTCPICGYRWPLNKDGRLSTHGLYDGMNKEKKRVCKGSKTNPMPELRKK